MGRYVSGDFSYKFVVGVQSSNFGEILDEILLDYEEKNWDTEDFDIDDIATVERWISNKETGERVELIIYDKDQFISACLNFDYYFSHIKPDEEDLEAEATLKMIKEFVGYLQSTNYQNGTQLNFFIEY